MSKKVTHIYFGDHRSHPIIMNYLNHSQVQVKILDAPKFLGSRLTRLTSLIAKLRALNKTDQKILHTHDLLSFYVSRFIYPFKNVIFDSHEVYSSYFKFPLNVVVGIFEELATIISTTKILPSPERRNLYTIKSGTVVVENLFIPSPNIEKNMPLDRDFKSFVYAGLLSKHRCVAELVDVFRDMPSIKLTIYGNKNKYMSQILEGGLPDNVEYVGSVPHADLMEKLPGYAASFALYRPLDLNNKYPAPTKIFENEYSGIATIVLRSKYLDRLVTQGRLKNTFFLDVIDKPSLEAIIESGRLEDCQPNPSKEILWKSQLSIINKFYRFRD